MKRQLSILSIILALAVNYAIAQKSTSGNAIILTDGDTLSSPYILKSKTKTNQDQIVYINALNQKLKLNASQIKAYYQDKESYFSEKLIGTDQYKLVRYEVGGYISFGLSYTSSGDMNFYVKKDEDVTSLEKYKYELKSFFSGYLPDFDQFYASYKVKLSYDLKTLAEMISAYNAYKFPDKYVFEPTKNKEKGNIGLLASGGMMITKLSGNYEEKLTGGLYGFGIDIGAKYSRYIGIRIPITYNSASGKGSNTSISMSTINIEPYLTFTPIPTRKFNFEFGAGIGLLYSLNSYLDCSALIIADQNKVNFSKMSFGPNLSFSVNLNRKLKTQFMFSQYMSKTSNLKALSSDDTSLKARINNFRLAISYYF